MNHFNANYYFATSKFHSFFIIYSMQSYMCMVHVVHRIWKLFFFFHLLLFCLYMNNKVQQNSFKKVNKCKENTRNMIDDRKYVLNLWIFIMLLCLEINKMCIFMLIHLISLFKKNYLFHFVFLWLIHKWRYKLDEYSST